MVAYEVSPEGQQDPRDLRLHELHVAANEWRKLRRMWRAIGSFAALTTSVDLAAMAEGVRQGSHLGVYPPVSTVFIGGLAAGSLVRASMCQANARQTTQEAQALESEQVNYLWYPSIPPGAEPIDPNAY